MNRFTIALVALLAPLPALAQEKPPENPFADLKLQSPECIRYDPEREIYLISNINGKMTATDDNGFITRVEKDGSAKLKWIAGTKKDITLHAPKGMQIVGDRLYVADVDHLRVYDMTTGVPLGAVKVPGAQFLNGVAVVRDGPIFVTDSGTKKKSGAVYMITDETEVRPLVEAEIERPNGIDIDAQGRIWVASYGSDDVVVLSPEGEVLERHGMPAGQLDGLVVRPGGEVMVSSWKGHSIYQLETGGTPEALVEGLVQPACFEVGVYNGDEALLIPQVKLNKVTVVPLSDLPATVSPGTPGKSAAADSGKPKKSDPAKEAKSAEADPGKPKKPDPAKEAEAKAAPPGGATVAVAQSDQYGQHLVDANGRAIYLFTADNRGEGGQETAVSNCYGECANVWPPVISGDPPQAEPPANSGLLDRIERKNGKMQATYEGWPLYYYAKDKGPGKAEGQDVHGFGGEWYLLRPSGEKVGGE